VAVRFSSGQCWPVLATVGSGPRPLANLLGTANILGTSAKLPIRDFAEPFSEIPLVGNRNPGLRLLRTCLSLAQPVTRSTLDFIDIINIFIYSILIKRNYKILTEIY
jgi:hypothetical protein